MKMADTYTKGTLFIVATPIGNTDDFSARALSTLSSVDTIFAEDTRRTGKLLSHFAIKTKMQCLHDHNESNRLHDVISLIKSGQNVALVSDAGTPLINDPGYKLVKTAHQEHLKVVPIPGACAFVSALSVAGIPTDKFSFEGFLPAKKQARRELLKGYLSGLLEDRTLVFYETPHRIIASLEDMYEILGEEQEVSIARELTKTYESLYVGSLGNVISTIKSDINHQKGEFVLILSGKKFMLKSGSSSENGISPKARDTLQTLLTELTVKQAVSLAVKLTGEKKKLLYSEALVIESLK